MIEGIIGFFFSSIIGILVFAFTYLLPTTIAIIRKRRNTGAIFLLNLLLGWTFVGWVVALVWAVKK